MLEKTNKGEGCFEWRSLRSTGMNRSDTIRAHGGARQACMTGLIPAQPSFLLAPVFPGCHVILSPCDPSRYRTAPVLPSLDKRAGIEPALSLLVAGIEPAPTVFRHGRSRLKLYQLSYTNKGFDCCGNRHRNIPSADCEFDAIKPLVDDGFPISIRSAHFPTARDSLWRQGGVNPRKYRAACAIQVTQPNTQRRAGLYTG